MQSIAPWYNKGHQYRAKAPTVTLGCPAALTSFRIPCCPSTPFISTGSGSFDVSEQSQRSIIHSSTNESCHLPSNALRSDFQVYLAYAVFKFWVAPSESFDLLRSFMYIRMSDFSISHLLEIGAKSRHKEVPRKSWRGPCYRGTLYKTTTRTSRRAGSWRFARSSGALLNQRLHQSSVRPDVVLFIEAIEALVMKHDVREVDRNFLEATQWPDRLEPAGAAYHDPSPFRPVQSSFPSDLADPITKVRGTDADFAKARAHRGQLFGNTCQIAHVQVEGVQVCHA